MYACCHMEISVTARWSVWMCSNFMLCPRGTKFRQQVWNVLDPIYTSRHSFQFLSFTQQKTETITHFFIGYSIYNSYVYHTTYAVMHCFGLPFQGKQESQGPKREEWMTELPPEVKAFGTQLYYPNFLRGGLPPLENCPPWLYRLFRFVHTPTICPPLP